MSTGPCILFAGGGSGGHIAPNLAIIERLSELGVNARPHMLVSARAIDERVLQPTKLPFTALPAQPLVLRPGPLLRFLKAFRQSERLVGQLIAQQQVAAMVATGGFVSGPSVSAARKAGVPVALVNLDAVPGRANRLSARAATEVFSVYPETGLPRVRTIGLPIRRGALATLSQAKARWELGLRPDLETLIVTAGSQGGGTINKMMIELSRRTVPRRMIGSWQVVHLTGEADRDAVAEAYKQAGWRARVEPFSDRMDLVYGAASLAICRAGANSVAEAWANHVPTVFFPYPFHKDEHQRLNAEPLVNRGAAMMLKDQIDPVPNVQRLTGPLLELIRNDARRAKMRDQLRETAPPDGALAIARWLITATSLGPAKVAES